MKIILNKTIPGLGRTGDLLEVPDGYARNYLIPGNIGIAATAPALVKVQADQNRRINALKLQTVQFDRLQTVLGGTVINISAKSSEKGKLFGSIHGNEISRAIREQRHEQVNPEQIRIPSPLDYLGDHDVEIRLTPKIRIHFTVRIQKNNG